MQNGWVYPGDLATWDTDEFVTIVGRKDDMLISGGENVHEPFMEGKDSARTHPDFDPSFMPWIRATDALTR